jgi:hypothetical protein
LLLKGSYTERFLTLLSCTNVLQPKLIHLYLIFTHAYVFSSTKLEIRAEQVLPEARGVWGRGWGWGAGGRNDPNNVCTCE